MKNILDILIDDFHERALPELMLRHQSMVWVPRKANVVIGMRRSGKTWFCYQQMRELLEKGLEKERLLYLNFEDERLLPFSANDFQLILETYYRKFPAFKSKQCYLFLDEVQRIEGWDKFVRRVLDTEKLSVCVTGSSSKLREFLSFKKAILKSGQRFGSKTRAMLQNLISQYIKIGGFPEVQAFDDELRRDVLRNYLDVVILRDVIERHSITNTLALRSLMKHVMSAPATRFSVNKFYNSLRSQGIACTKNSLYDYIAHLTDTFLFYQVPIHSRSERARRVNPKKIYVIDSGLQEAMSLRMMGDRGALLENLVYMHFRRQGLAPEYYVTKNGVEVDFVLSAKDRGEYRLIQVCWDIHDPDTQKREVGALLSAMDELGLKRGTIVTWLDEDLSDKRLEIVPAWKWLLAE